MHAVEMPSSTMTASLEQGRVDAVTFAGPLLAQALDTSNVRLLARPMAEVIGRNRKFVLTAYFTTPSYADANPRVVQAFLRGVLQADAYVNRHHDETAPLVSEILGVDVQAVLHSQRIEMREALDPNDLQPFIDLLYKYKIIDKPLVAKDLYVSAVLNTAR